MTAQFRYLLSDFKTGLNPSPQALTRKVAETIRISQAKIQQVKIVKRSLDARKKPNLLHVLQVEFTCETQLEPLPHNVRPLTGSTLDIPAPAFMTNKATAPRRMDPVVIVGSGPAGLFAAMALGRAGVRVVLLERGKPVAQRLRDIGLLRTEGKLDPESNICFGEGGAGTYTDGKLYTRIKHPYARWILKAFTEFGAKDSILVDSHPHLGTETLVEILRGFRKHLIEFGVDIRFETRMERLLLREGKVVGVRLAGGTEVPASHVVLAIGHSARDTLENLQQDGVPMQCKDFAVGIRIEHPQELINKAQYGKASVNRNLGAADYRLTHSAGGRGIYSFCMCPGGFIVPSPTERGHMAVNGMSNSNRSTPFANSGVVVQVTPGDLFRRGFGESPLAGIRFQRSLEAAAYEATSTPYAAPAMLASDFMAGKASGKLVPTNFRPKAEAADLAPILPDWITAPLKEGLRNFNTKIRGYTGSEANILAVESRTSSPVRILRGPDGMSTGIQGLYPAGEGAGYAGGIVSAAVDGLKAAEAILADLGR